MKTLIRTSIASIILSAISLTSSDAAQFVTLTDTTNWTDTNFSYVGYSFTIGASDLSVSALGVFDTGPNGLISTDFVGILNSGGGHLAFEVFDAGTLEPLSNGFRWVTLSTPITLSAGQTYRTYLNATWQGNPFLEHIWVGSTANPALQFNSSIATINGSLTGADWATFYNAAPNAGQAKIGPNFQYTVVPEPTTAALLTGAGIVFSFRRRRTFSGNTQ